MTNLPEIKRNKLTIRKKLIITHVEMKIAKHWVNIPSLTLIEIDAIHPSHSTLPDVLGTFQDKGF